MTATVRLDRKAGPNYRALSDTIRADIEARIPEGCYLSVLSKTFQGHDYHARIFRGAELIAESLLCRYVEVACWQALRRAGLAA